MDDRAVVELIRSLGAGSSEPIALPEDASPAIRAAVHELAARRSEQRRLEEAELLFVRCRFESALQVRDAFLTRMSHELRTPLNAILGYVELLLDEAEGDDAADLDRVRAAALNLLAIVSSVLDLTQLQAGSYEIVPEAVGLERLCREVLDSVRICAETNRNQVELRIEPGLVVALDRRMLHSILYNLTSNGCKYTTNGTITLAARRAGDRLQLAVSDTGIGMTQRQIEEAYRPFSQADETTTRRYDGAGLGLAVVRGFVEAMGGSVTIESGPGRGARVQLDLPMLIEPRSSQPQIFEDEPTLLLR
jgi:signal transduction histidine kinase